MLTLDLSSAPFWCELLLGMRVKLRPLTTALMVASRADPAIAALTAGTAPEEAALAMAKALAHLGDGPFIAVNGDVFCDADFNRLPHEPEGLAHLLLVDNPEHNPAGDFALDGARVRSDGDAKLTFAGIGVYRPALLNNWRDIIGSAPGVDLEPPRFKLAPLLRKAMDAGRVSGCHHGGQWTDVGTPERLAQLDATLGSTTA